MTGVWSSASAHSRCAYFGGVQMYSELARRSMMHVCSAYTFDGNAAIDQGPVGRNIIPESATS
eukprot:6192469-Pleurochrysis_carterae.AAC.2